MDYCTSQGSLFLGAQNDCVQGIESLEMEEENKEHESRICTDKDLIFTDHPAQQDAYHKSPAVSTDQDVHPAVGTE